MGDHVGFRHVSASRCSYFSLLRIMQEVRILISHKIQLTCEGRINEDGKMLYRFSFVLLQIHGDRVLSRDRFDRFEPREKNSLRLSRKYIPRSPIAQALFSKYVKRVAMPIRLYVIRIEEEFWSHESS